MPRALPTPSVERFTVEPSGPPRAHAVCVHGYTSTPYEVRVVADALAAIGVSCVAPLLHGHGRDAAELNRMGWEDWALAADTAFDSLPPHSPRILVGSSMGALLTLRLAALHPEKVRAMVLLSPALLFQPQGMFAGALARRGAWRLVPMVTKAQRGGDIHDDEGRDKNPTYPVLPMRGVGELAKLQDVVLPLLPKVTAPLCVFHGGQDHTIDPASAALVCERVSSPFTERHMLRDSFHVIGLDVDRDEIAHRTVAFVERVLGPIAASGAASGAA